MVRKNTERIDLIIQYIGADHKEDSYDLNAQKLISCWQKGGCFMCLQVGTFLRWSLLDGASASTVGKGKVFYGQKPPSGESTTTECRVNYQHLKQPNGELLVAVNHNQLWTMSS